MGYRGLTMVPMKKLPMYALLVTGALLGACATFPAPIRDFGQCLVNSMQAQVDAILDEVKSALASKNFIALLLDLGKRVGFTAVDCAVAAIRGNAQARAAAGDAGAAVVVDHAQAWLAR